MHLRQENEWPVLLTPRPADRPRAMMVMGASAQSKEKRQFCQELIEGCRMGLQADTTAVMIPQPASNAPSITPREASYSPMSSSPPPAPTRQGVSPEPTCQEAEMQPICINTKGLPWVLP